MSPNPDYSTPTVPLYPYTVQYHCNTYRTPFTSHLGLFRFIRIPFGLNNAPATFQSAVDIIFSSVKSYYALVYLPSVAYASIEAGYCIPRGCGTGKSREERKGCRALGSRCITPGQSSRVRDAIYNGRPPGDNRQQVWALYSQVDSRSSVEGGIALKGRRGRDVSRGRDC